jgi:hypothetical protein
MIASLDLYVETKVLGQDSRFTREAGISFGRPRFGPVADAELSLLDQRRPDLTKWRFTALAVPFDLEDLPNGRHYTEAKVRMAFDDPDVRSVRLSRRTAEEPGQDSDLDTWGVGRSVLTWKLTARDRVGIRPRGREVFAIVESPMGTDRLDGTLDGSVRIIRKMLGMANESLAEPRCPLRFVLDLDGGDFAIVEA